MFELIFGNDDYEDFNIVIVTGTCRAGKTLLSQILATMEHVEWIEEPWMPMQIPVMEHLKLIDRKTAISLIRANFKELFNDSILLRNGNFRPNDLSSIWNVKGASEIFHRLNNICSRQEVKEYARENKSIFLLDLPEILPFIDLFYEAFPKLRVINVVRNGLAVAKHIEAKKWFSIDQLLYPTNNQVFQKYRSLENEKEFFLPWWVDKGSEEKFISYGEYSKGLYYWYRILNFNNFSFKEDKYQNYSVIRYEDIVSEAQKTVESLENLLKKKRTDRTYALISKIHKREIISRLSCEEIDKIEKELLKNIIRTMKSYGYKL